MEAVQRRTIATSLAKGLEGRWFLENQLIPSEGGLVDVQDPARGQLIAGTCDCTADEVDRAALSAKKALAGWQQLEIPQRAQLLRDMARKIRTNAEELSFLLALETGKALKTECVGELKLFADIFEYFGSCGIELKGRTVPFSNAVIAMTSREPIGVVAGIVPWNMPLMFLGYKVAAPLIAGNTVVLKVPEIAPFTILKVLELSADILPAGVVNAVVGYGRSTGQALVEHPLIAKVSFTGSVESGRSVYRTAARDLKQVNLELGGKSPMLILPDCDMHKAVEGAVSGIRFTRQAQSCTSSTRVFIDRARLDSFVEQVIQRAGNYVIGDPLDDNTETGAIVSREQHRRILDFLERARAEGLEPLVSGKLPEEEELAEGTFMQPHFFVEPPHDAEIVQKEIFGPVMCIFAYDDLEQAIEMSNDVTYGLSASIWGQDITRCMTLAKRMEVGFVQINQNAVMLPGLSYAGTKSSGFGSESSLESMMQSFTREKTTIVNLSS